ncbi:putative glycosyltransferase [Gordonia effusa NBRC 100432]|uniref:Putative glycosyltransferase n=2 Tax=Gordonia effusa TaxID=263908 RepID=H0R5G9_9ACTN|nr:putative glycosyltransferase [Gordonia effusa NBRC 100432]
MVSAHADPLADTSGPSSGGQNIHIAELSSALTRHGHDITVYTRRACAHGARERVADAGYRVVRIDAGPPVPIPRDEVYNYLHELTDGLSIALAADRPDIVHAHFWMSAIAAELAAFPERLPVVVTYHSLGCIERKYAETSDIGPTQRIPLETVAGRRATAIAATCTDEVRNLHEMGVPTQRIKIIPRGVDIDRFGDLTTAWPNAVPARKQRYRVAVAGSLLPRKGIETVIEAIAGVRDAELIVSGGPVIGEFSDDPYFERLMRCAASHSVEDRVTFLGSIPHEAIPALLRSADIVAHVPWYESFGMVAIEAMAVGTPVVTSAVGGMLDTVIPGVTGEHVAARDAGALAATLTSLLADEAKLRSYARIGRERIRQHYQWSDVALKTERLYRRILDDARDRRAARTPVGASSAQKVDRVHLPIGARRVERRDVVM